MKKFSEWIGTLREAEKKEQSDLQKSYQEYFKAKLSKFGAESPADLDDEEKKKFFNEISADWEKGKGVKPEAKEKLEKEKEKAKEEEKKKPAEEIGELEGDSEEKMKELTKVKESESLQPINEDFVIIGAIITAVLGYKLLRNFANKIIGRIGRNREPGAERLKRFINQCADDAIVDLSGADKTRAENWRKFMLDKVDSGEYKTWGDIEDALALPENVFN